MGKLLPSPSEGEGVNQMKSVKNPEPNAPNPISVDFFDALPELLYIIYFGFFIVYHLKWANSSFAFGFLEHLLDQTATTVANCCHEERACCWTGASACVCRSPKDNIAESHPRVHRSIYTFSVHFWSRLGKLWHHQDFAIFGSSKKERFPSPLEKFWGDWPNFVHSPHL